MENRMRWKFIVKRDLSVLFYDLINNGQTKKKMKELLGVDFGYDNNRVVEADVAYIEEEQQEARDYAKKMYEQHGAPFFLNLLNKWYAYFKELEDMAATIASTNYTDWTNEELLEEFGKLAEVYTQCSTGLNAPVTLGTVLEDIIKKRLKEVQKAEEYFRILPTPEKDTEGTKELKSMLQMATQREKGKDVTRDIQNHIKHFGWINTRGFYDDAWTTEQIQERLYAIENAEERLKELREHSKKVKKETDDILTEIEADKGFREFVAITKEFVYFRTHRMDMFVKCGFIARPLFREIARRAHVEMHDLFFLTTAEVKNVLRGDRAVIKQIKERKKGFARIQNKDTISVLTGKELEAYKQKEGHQKIDKDSTEIKGTIACKGIAQGTVKVVLGKEELSKVRKGDILVASMTTPDFMIAMEKAAAFVTDEGGIVSHAAIVSREMNKPCIMGTRIATKVFKDGDIIEVDAEKGIVRKI